MRICLNMFFLFFLVLNMKGISFSAPPVKEKEDFKLIRDIDGDLWSKTFLSKIIIACTVLEQENIEIENFPRLKKAKVKITQVLKGSLPGETATVVYNLFNLSVNEKTILFIDKPYSSYIDTGFNSISLPKGSSVHMISSDGGKYVVKKTTVRSPRPYMEAINEVRKYLQIITYKLAAASDDLKKQFRKDIMAGSHRDAKLGIKGICSLKSSADVLYIAELAKNHASAVQVEAIQELGDRRLSGTVPDLIGVLQKPDLKPNIYSSAMTALAKIGSRNAVSFIVDNIEDKRSYLNLYASNSVLFLTDRSAVQILISSADKALKANDLTVFSRMLMGLGNIGGDEVKVYLWDLLKKDFMKPLVAKALLTSGDERGKAVLFEMMNGTKDPNIRLNAANILVDFNLSPSEFGQIVSVMKEIEKTGEGYKVKNAKKVLQKIENRKLFVKAVSAR